MIQDRDDQPDSSDPFWYRKAITQAGIELRPVFRLGRRMGRFGVRVVKRSWQARTSWWGRALIVVCLAGFTAAGFRAVDVERTKREDQRTSAELTEEISRVEAELDAVRSDTELTRRDINEALADMQSAVSKSASHCRGSEETCEHFETIGQSSGSSLRTGNADKAMAETLSELAFLQTLCLSDELCLLDPGFEDRLASLGSTPEGLQQ